MRNLQEQVQKNKEDIAAHYNIDRVLANFGIKVVGAVSSPSDLDDIIGENYGDAYAVGASEPYSFYIWTRADANSGHPEDYWFDIGPLAIVGPQGPQGPEGPIGPKGEATRLVSGPTAYNNAKEGDIWLNTTDGNVYKYSDSTWILTGNLRGPQGVQGNQGPQGPRGLQGDPGPKGDTGDVGGFINIYGILTNSDQLPDPETLNNRTIAYLIGTAFPYDLYIQVGDADGPVLWINSGPLNVSTLVFVNGEAQNTWDADTKLDKVTTTSSLQQVYSKNINGTQTMVNMSSSTVGSSLVQRQANSNIQVPVTPVAEGDATSKKYVDDAIANAGSGGGSSKLYTFCYIVKNPKTTTGESLGSYLKVVFESDETDTYVWHLGRNLNRTGYSSQAYLLMKNIETDTSSITEGGKMYLLSGVFSIGRDDLTIIYSAIDGSGELFKKMNPYDLNMGDGYCSRSNNPQ